MISNSYHDYYCVYNSFIYIIMLCHDLHMCSVVWYAYKLNLCVVLIFLCNNVIVNIMLHGIRSWCAIIEQTATYTTNMNLA